MWSPHPHGPHFVSMVSPCGLHIPVVPMLSPHCPHVVPTWSAHPHGPHIDPMLSPHCPHIVPMLSPHGVHIPVVPTSHVVTTLSPCGLHIPVVPMLSPHCPHVVSIDPHINPPIHPTIHTPTDRWGVSTNHKSSNRIELSRLGPDLFDF